MRVEIHSPRGFVKEIGRMKITNRGGLNTASRGDYDIFMFRRGCRKRVQRQAEVLDFPRLSYGVWALILRGLKAALEPEPKFKKEQEKCDA